MDFVEAYRVSPREGAVRLANLVAGPELAAWVRWLDVQHREFAGSIDATADVRDVEFVQAIEAQRASGAQVGLSASVIFTFDPVDDDAIELSRILDGPVTLVRTSTGAYRVFDLLRNGVPMSDGIELFRGETQTDGGVRVVLDSLFMFPPNWQFNLIVENDGDRDVLLDTSALALFDGDRRIDGIGTGSLVVIPPGGAVDGILVFPAQDAAAGRTLAFSYLAGEEVLRFQFPLEDIVTVVPPPPPTDAGTEEVAPS